MQLKNVVPWGRSSSEYHGMFMLSEDDLQRKILGCGDGPSSFNAQMNDKGVTITSVDPVYAFSAAQIEARIEETSEIIVQELQKEPEKYVWSEETPDVQALKQHRLDAMQLFLEDYDLGKLEGRYVEGKLPELDFETESFDLVLCSHFLFLYGELFDYEFHADAVFELLRVATEVRIFPVVDLKGTISPYIEPLIEELEEEGFMCSLQTVSYEFQKGANQMLVIN